MKTKLSVNIAQALKDLGVDVVTHVPGYGASEVYMEYNTLQMKQNPEYFNEEVAYAVAYGASIFGMRSTSLMKSQGFLKAANAAMDSLYANLTAGFVTIIFEDKDGSHSDNVVDIEPILKGMYFPYKKCNAENADDELIECYLESEQKQMPYVLLVDSSNIEKEVKHNIRDDVHKTFIYKRDLLSHYISPLFAKYQYKIFTAKKLDGDLTIINKPHIPTIPNELPNRYAESVKKYQPLFDIFQKVRGEVVCGDTSTSSLFALPPYNCVDTLLHIGGSIPMAIGAYLAGKRNVWATTGDFGFISAGHMALIEVCQRNIPLKIIIFNNKQAAATGGQHISKKIIYKLLSGYENNLKYINDTNNPIEIGQVLIEAKESNDLRIILADYN